MLLEICDGIIYISHRMAEIFAHSDRVTVLRDGRDVHYGDIAETTPDQLVRAMVGRDLGQYFPPKRASGTVNELLLEVLDIADADLAMSGRSALPGLPGLFAADHQLVMSFTELDPYAAARPPHAYVLPAVRESSGAPKGGQGDEIFGYFVRQLAPELALWEGLAASGKTVRIHMHDPAPAHLERFRTLGLIFEPKPQSFDAIVARSRLVVSHGGHGFASASALAGLPQMIVAFDLEKYLVGDGVRKARLGIDHNLFTLDPPAFGQVLADLWADEALARDCRARAAELVVRELPIWTLGCPNQMIIMSLMKP